MIKNTIFVILTSLLLVPIASAISANCGLINVDYNNEITLNAGESGSFTVTVFNQGVTTQRISASAQCNPVQLECSISGISSDTLLGAGEQKVFTLDVQAHSAGSFPIPAEFRAGPSSPTCTSNLQFNANVLDARTGNIPPITVSIDPVDYQNARQGDKVEFTLSVKNNLNKKLFTTISSKGTNPFESSTSLTASNIALESGETKFVTISITLPPGTPGGRYNWIYNVDAGRGSNYNVDMPVEVIVDGPTLDLQLLGSPVQDVCTVVSGGQSVSIPLSIENNAEVTGPFELSIDGTRTAQNIVTVSEPRFTLQNGEEKQFNIVISPHARTPIDTYSYKLKGRYQGFTFLDRSFCFKIQGVESAVVNASRNIVIERMRLSTTVINITNTGTVRDEYALGINPSGDSLLTEIQPATFTLNPSQMQEVTLSFTSSLTTALGQRTIEMLLDAQNYSKNIDLNATIYSTGKTGESLLSIISEREVSLPSGIAKALEVTVENVGSDVLTDVEVTLKDVDVNWYETESKTILPGEAEVFEVVVTIPSTTNEQQIETSVVATSGFEFVEKPLTIIITNVMFDFVIHEIIENKNSNGETTSVDLIINLTNNGRSTATQIAPLISDLDYIYFQTPESVTLEQGQQAQVRVTLKPANRNTDERDVSLQFAAQEGVSNTRSTNIPSLTIAQSGITFKIAVILILLIGIVAVLAKTEGKI